MALTHLLDTSVYSQPIRDNPQKQVMDRWSALSPRAVCISSVVHAEILLGLQDRQSQKCWRRYRELLQDTCPVLPFDSSVAEEYSRLAVELKRAGKPRPMADLMIAATASRHGLVVATLNARDFEGIPGLSVEDWGKP